jgi:hypothetical protein
MPFIGTLLNKFAPRPIELYLERLQIVSCDTIVTLNAFIPNEDPNNRYQWVQLSGLIVTWLTPTNEITATFEQTLVRDDKLFRLYVNQGSDNETFADILVTAIPRDNIPHIKESPRFYTQAYQGESYADESVAIAKLIPGISPEGTVSVNNPFRGVQYNLPTLTDLTLPTKKFVTEFRVYDVTGGTETFVVAYPPDATGFFNVPMYKSYRVDTVLVVDGQEHIAKGIPAGFFPTNPNWMDMDTFDYGPINLKSNNKLLQTFNNVVYQTIRWDYEDNLYQSLTDWTRGLYNTYTRYPLTLFILPTQQDDLLAHLADGNFYMTYDRLDLGVGGLGGRT